MEVPVYVSNHPLEVLKRCVLQPLTLREQLLGKNSVQNAKIARNR